MRPSACTIRAAVLLAWFSAIAPASGPALAEAGGQGAVLVYRGSSAMGRTPAPVPPPAPVHAVAGGRLWIVDPDGGRLTGCALERTTMVGGRRVRCAATRLPSGEP